MEQNRIVNQKKTEPYVNRKGMHWIWALLISLIAIPFLGLTQNRLMNSEAIVGNISAGLMSADTFVLLFYALRLIAAFVTLWIWTALTRNRYGYKKGWVLYSLISIAVSLVFQIRAISIDIASFQALFTSIYTTLLLFVMLLFVHALFVLYVLRTRKWMLQIVNEASAFPDDDDETEDDTESPDTEE